MVVIIVKSNLNPLQKDKVQPQQDCEQLKNLGHI